MIASTLFPSAGHLLGWSFLSVVTAVLVTWRVAPARWRPVGRVRALAVTSLVALGAYVAVSVGHDTGFNGWLDYDVIDATFQAEVDGTDAWVVSSVAALAVLGVARLLRRSR